MKTLLYTKNLFGNVPIGIRNDSPLSGRSDLGGRSPAESPAKPLTLKECFNQEADKVIRRYHYSKKTTRNRFLSFSVNNGMGYLQLGYGIRPRKKHTISDLITADNYCEFDRMWLSDELPKNSESQVIGLLLSYLKQVYPRIRFVISYADGSVGNTGTIYKASNAIYIGKVPVDFYLLPSGERVHPVSMYHRHKTRAKAFLEKQYPGIRHIKDDWQYRFLYILNRGLRKRFQERNAINQMEGSGRFRPSAPQTLLEAAT